MRRDVALALIVQHNRCSLNIALLFYVSCQAKINEASRVINIGSGLGGPARYLAGKTSAHSATVSIDWRVKTAILDLLTACCMALLLLRSWLPMTYPLAWVSGKYGCQVLAVDIQEDLSRTASELTSR